MNAIERALAGNFVVAQYGPAVFNQFADFVTKSPPGPERTWFELNAATWPVIKINGPLKYQAARALTRDIEAAAKSLGPKRMLRDQQIAYLQKLDAELRSDLVWQTGDVAKLRNIVGNLINGLSSAALSILNNLHNIAAGGPLSPAQQGQQLVFSALYASVDRLFREGQAFDADAWQKAIQQSLAEAAADDIAAAGKPLRALLLEFYKLTDRLIDIERGEAERQALRDEIERQLDAIRKKIEFYQAQFKEPQLLEAVQLELSRQPKYVLAVIYDYERLTQKRVRPLVCVTPTIGTQKICTGLFPFGVLLAVRSRESEVRANEAGNRPHRRNGVDRDA